MYIIYLFLRSPNIDKIRVKVGPKTNYFSYIHGTAPPPYLGGELKISDQNNWGGPEQKINFGMGGG